MTDKSSRKPQQSMEDIERRKAAAQEQALCTASARASRSAEETIQLGMKATLDELKRRQSELERSGSPTVLATISSDEQRELLVNAGIIHEGSTAASSINRRLLKEGLIAEVALFTSQAGNSAEYRKVYCLATVMPEDSLQQPSVECLMNDLMRVIVRYRLYPELIFKALKALIYGEGVRDVLPPWLNLILGRTSVNHLVYKK